MTLQNTSTEDKNNQIDNPVEFHSNNDVSPSSVVIKIFKILKTHQETKPSSTLNLVLVGNFFDIENNEKNINDLVLRLSKKQYPLKLFISFQDPYTYQDIADAYE